MATKLEQAMQAVQSGNLAAGQSLLAQLIRDDPGNETAWLWLANVLDDPLKQRQCLEKVLQINPENEQAWRDLARLESGEEAPAPDVPAIAPAEVKTPEPLQAASPFLPVDLTAEETQPGTVETGVEAEVNQDTPAGMEEFWAGLASVKKETLEIPVERGEAGVQADTLPEEEIGTAYPWLASEEIQGIGSDQQVKGPEPDNFNDFLKSLKESGEYQEVEDPSTNIEIEEEPVDEAEIESGWADSSAGSVVNEPVREDEFPMAAVASSVGETVRSQPQKSKMSRSQINVIIILAVITFLLLLAALAYIIWDLTL